MSDIMTLDIHLTLREFDRAEQAIERLQSFYPAMTVDDAVDFIFRVGMLYLCDQNVVALDAHTDADAPFGQAGQIVAAVLA